jgi:adenine-specific DNA-methyltransferase
MSESVKVDLNSENPNAARLEQLQALFPEVFAEDKVDFAKLRLALGDEVDEGKERYGLNWAGKADAYRAIQVPSVGTLIPDKEESVDWDTTENVIIEGDNLEVLKLLQKSYHGKVKLILIDPPYNTGGEFIYPDNFKEGLKGYMEFTKQMADGIRLTTNTELNGRFHSDWLSMIFPRLFVARQLLSQDGLMALFIDDHEISNVRMVLDEIFGEENFVGCCIWQHSIQPKGYTGKLSVHHNYVLLYSRSDEFALSSLNRKDEHNKSYSNPDNDPKGLWRTGDVRNALFRRNLIFEVKTPSGGTISPPENGWRWSKETIERKIQSGEIIFSRDEKRIIRKIYLADQEGRVPESIMYAKDVGSTRTANTELKSLFEDPPFDTPKPTGVLEHFVKLSGASDYDLVLDFFAGSGSLGQAVQQFNIANGTVLKYIMCQIPERTDLASWPTIAHVTRDRMKRFAESFSNRQALLPTNSEALDLGFRSFKLMESNFKVWNLQEAPIMTDLLAQNLLAYSDSQASSGTKDGMLWELILKLGNPLSSKVKSIEGVPGTFGIVESNDTGGGDRFSLVICLL